MFTRTVDRAKTLLALGPVNLARVGVYRLGLRLGVHPVLKLVADAPTGPYFGNNAPHRPGVVAIRSWETEAVLFSHHRFPLSGIPDWHANPFQPGFRADSRRHWSRLPDFDPAVGDIKTVWEASRFEWLVAMAQRASLGSTAELARLNTWLEDWSRANAPYLGVNWKCGQEASIRVMHLAVAAIILGETQAPTASLQELVRLHLARIAPTISYAIGQQNNHGTSEAAALFIGGSWLARLGHPDGRAWMQTGRRWLEDRAQVLIDADGTFSQYSVVYHRVVLDTYSIAEVWRRHLDLPPFSDALTTRLAAATLWLQQLTDPQTGDAPNLGANDGARLLPLTDAGFRDFRPSLQLAANLFKVQRCFASSGVWDQPGLWLGVNDVDGVLSAPDSTSLDDGGLHVLRRGKAVAYLRYPRFRFRPSQADALHLDFWLDGQNLIRDAGTFSYNSTVADVAYCGGTSAHATVQFDGRDQMPRLSRFLFGGWLQASRVTPVTETGASVTAAAGYCDGTGAKHHRTIALEANRLICVDRLEGTAKNAVLRWRLQPGDWSEIGNGVTNGLVQLRVSCDREIPRSGVVVGYESLHYLTKTPLPVLEIECAVPATLTTEIVF
jgi:Heparinase II/III-like protein/Heparinase II/III N-terminus